MQILFIFSLLVSINLVCYSQGIKPRNVYRVTVTSRHLLENGKSTGQQHAVNQEIYDSLGRLHTEIDFNRETLRPENYRWHYYDSMLLVRTEHFVNDQLYQRVIFIYGPGDLVSRELHYRVQDGDTLLFRTVSYTYNSAGLARRIKALNSPGKLLFRVRSSFDANGTETRRRVSGRRGEPDDGILRLDRATEFESSGLLMSESLKIRMGDRSGKEYSRNFQYDERQNLIGMTEFDDNGKQFRRIEYVWQDDRNRLSQIRYYDANDLLEKHLTKRYEIYRTTDRRQRVIDN
jgi:hypothetical protein